MFKIKTPLIFVYLALASLLLVIPHTAHSVFGKTPKEKLLSKVDSLVAKNKKKAKKEGARSFTSGDFIQQYVIDANIQAYLETIKDDLLANHQFDFDEEVKIFVTYGNNYNAHATSNNNIFIPSGWIYDAKSKDIIAAIIAHELSHLILYHPATSIARAKGEKSVTQFSKVAVMGTMLANSQLNKSSNGLSLGVKNGGQNKIMKAIMIGQLLIEAKSSFINPNINRKQEAQADFLAIDLLMTAGYKYEGLIDMFEYLRQEEIADEQKIKDAIQTMKDAREEFNQDAKNQLEGGKLDKSMNTYLDGWMKGRLEIITFKFKGFLAKKKNSHLLPSKRIEKAKKYYLAHYPQRKKKNQKANEEEFKNKKKELKFDEIHRLHVQVDNANLEIDKGNVSQGARMVNSALGKLRRIKPRVKYPMPWVVFGKARLIQGRHSDVVENLYDKVIKDKKISHTPLDAYTLMAESYVKNNQNDKANEIIALAVEQFGDDTSFQIHQAIMNCKANNNDAFRESIDICVKNPSPAISTRCIELETNIDVYKVKNPDKEWWKQCELGTPYTAVSIAGKENKAKLLQFTTDILKKSKINIKVK
jgi:predicted Zn-dependent protease